MKKFICTLAAVAALAWMSAVPANALTCTDACTSDIGYPTFWTFGGDGGGNFGGTVSGGFTAQYGFTLLGPPPPGYESVTNSITTGGKIITGLTLSLYSCTAADCSTFIAAPIATTSTTVIALGNQAISLSAFLLPGTYFFELTGTAADNTNYGGTIGVTATPLPAALPLFVSGLGALGFAGLPAQA
jgi:hypothetical protein